MRRSGGIKSEAVLLVTLIVQTKYSEAGVFVVKKIKKFALLALITSTFLIGALAEARNITCKNVSTKDGVTLVHSTLTLDFDTGTVKASSEIGKLGETPRKVSRKLIEGAFCTESGQIDPRLSSCFLQSSTDIWPIVQIFLVDGFGAFTAWNFEVRSPDLKSMTDSELTDLGMSRLPGKTLDVSDAGFAMNDCQLNE